MTLSRVHAKSAPSSELPDDLYIGFVDNLLVDIGAVFFSSLVVTIIEVVAALAVKSALLWGCAAVQLLVCAVRLYFMGLHARQRPSPNVEAAHRHERMFAIGAVSSLAAVSLWTLLAFYVTDDGFTRFFAATMTTAFAFGMSTRSFAIYRGVNLQLAAAFIPLSAAMIVAGGWYPVGIFIGFIPLVLYMKGSASRVRANFMAVVAAQSKVAFLANRLDLALNNMSHGLLMIDSKGRVTVFNRQLLSLFRLDPADLATNARVRPLMQKLVRRGVVAKGEIERIWAALTRANHGVDTVVPLETLDDRAIEITVHGMEGEGAVVVVQDVTERRNAARAIDRLARVDTVTELPNRRRFEEELSETLRIRLERGENVNVLFIDLDDFKQVNDSLGHARGDQLLIEIANRLKAIMQPADLVARWGGDEFAILQHSASDRAQTAELADRILHEIRRPVFIDGYEVIVGASIGSATAPQDGATQEAILSNADMALYAAKGDGRGNWRAFEKSMDAKIQIRRLIELDLRAAVANDAIEVYFQPIVKVETGKIAGFEALARWNHPVRGRVSPGEFIPIVEELGLMDELGASVLRRACLACASWPGDACISVNLSPVQFRNNRVLETVRDALAMAKLPPERLDLEITESTLLDDRGSTRETLNALRRLGVRISLDDFGTGYSSLSYVLAFPLDRIKIDRAFTIGLGLQERASILVESVAQMCGKLGMSVLVEGVETDLQLRFIERLGTISEVQGFYFSPAVPEPEARRMLEGKKRLVA
ncbi:MAG: EAL domain-containing protein [Bradyrhizobium sp.]|nr:MAG: EAL domain-containing protein [Bradyrhizobium sp.]